MAANNPSPLKTPAPPLPRAGGVADVRAFLSGREGLAFVRAVVRRYARSPDEEGEIVAVACLRLVEVAERYADVRGREGLEGWIATVARRAAIEVLRGRGRRERVFRSGEGDEERDGPIARAGRAAVEVDPGLRAAILHALARCPLEMAEAWWVVEMEGLTWKEAAARLGCAPGTILSRVARIRSRLRAELAEFAK